MIAGEIGIRTGYGVALAPASRASVGVLAEPLGAAITGRVAAAGDATRGGEARNWLQAHAPPVPAPPVPAPYVSTAFPTAALPPASRASQPDHVTLARLAQAVYVDGATLPGGWREATSADMRAIGVRPSDLVSSGSAFRARVYAEGSGADRRFVVAFRGSTTDRGDWIANGRQAAGLQTDHYRAALLVGRQLARGRSDADVTITGHSLGGGLTAAAALAAGRDAVTFNAAGLSPRTIAAAQATARETGIGRAPDIRAYHVRGEILSAMQDGGDRVVGALLGGVLGRQFVDAPEAFGRRTTLDAVRPADTAWWQDTPVARHGMDYVLAGLRAR